MTLKAFKEGEMVRVNIPGGTLARISIYLGESYYLVRTVPENREIVLEEKELIKEEVLK